MFRTKIYVQTAANIESSPFTSFHIHCVDQHGIKSWELTINNQQLGPFGLMNHVFNWFHMYSWGVHHWGWLNPHLDARQVRPPPGRAVSASPQHCGPCQMTWSGLRPARGPGAKGENMLKHGSIDETWPFLVQHIQNIDHYCMADAADGFATHMIHLPIFKDDNDQRSLDIKILRPSGIASSQRLAVVCFCKTSGLLCRRDVD